MSIVRNEVINGNWIITYDFEDPDPQNYSRFSFIIIADQFTDQLPPSDQYPTFSSGGAQPGDTDVSLNPSFVWENDSSGFDWVRLTLIPPNGGPVISGFYDLGFEADPGMFTPDDYLAPNTEYFAEVQFGRSVGVYNGFGTGLYVRSTSKPAGNLIPEDIREFRHPDKLYHNTRTKHLRRLGWPRSFVYGACSTSEPSRVNTCRIASMRRPSSDAANRCAETRKFGRSRSDEIACQTADT